MGKKKSEYDIFSCLKVNSSIPAVESVPKPCPKRTMLLTWNDDLQQPVIPEDPQPMTLKHNHIVMPAETTVKAFKLIMIYKVSS